MSNCWEPSRNISRSIRILVSTWRKLSERVPNWTEPSAKSSSRSLLACYIRCKCFIETSSILWKGQHRWKITIYKYDLDPEYLANRLERSTSYYLLKYRYILGDDFKRSRQHSCGIRSSVSRAILGIKRHRRACLTYRILFKMKTL